MTHDRLEDKIHDRLQVIIHNRLEANPVAGYDI
jgi:hypothetical protein